jgi:hypothetical protein
MNVTGGSSFRVSPRPGLFFFQEFFALYKSLDINQNALGGSAPATWHPPYAIMPYYLYTIVEKFPTDISEASHAP